MTRMREAFDEWMAHDDWRFADREAAWKWMYEAGYQAAIAAIKEGGQHWRQFDDTPYYKLPEDV